LFCSSLNEDRIKLFLKKLSLLSKSWMSRLLWNNSEGTCARLLFSCSVGCRGSGLQAGFGVCTI
jgi:hypothetical protein